MTIYNKVVYARTIDNHTMLMIKENKDNFTSKLLPICSCGWMGQYYEAYNNYQYCNVEEQIIKHSEELKK